MLNEISLAKINPPQLRHLLSRPLLLKYLERCRQYPLTLISANTGFGKTSLLTDFVRQAGLPCAWYSLDEGDRDPAVFCNYLLQAVRQLQPSFGATFEQLLQQNLTELHQKPIIERLADEFATALESQLENQFPAQPNTAPNQKISEKLERDYEMLIVLDDYQFAESVGVTQFVQRLAWRLPSYCHLLLATRTLPQNLPIVRLKAKHILTMLESPDLAFSVAEINQLLRDFYNIDEPTLGQQLSDYSEGWITAVVLALSSQSLLRQRDWQRLETNLAADELFNYLAQEVLQNQPPALQDFLVRSSVLKVLRPTACDALLPSGSPASEVLLKQLEARNLFIVRLNGVGPSAYQYHVLFRQFLESQLRQNPTLYRQMQLAAAAVEQAGGDFAEAVQHYTAAGEIEQAASLLDNVIETLYRAGRSQLLTTLLGNIAEVVQGHYPNILNIKARLLLESGDNEQALQTYRRAAQRYQEQATLDRAALAAANQAHILLRLDQRRAALEICGQVLQETAVLMASVTGQQAVALAKQVQGLIAVEEGASAAAEQNLREAAEIYRANQDNLRLATIDSSFGHLYYHDGRLVKSNIYFERALTYFSKSGQRNYEAYSRASLAIGCYLQGRYVQAEQQLNEALLLAQDLNDDFLRQHVLASLGNVYRDTERYAKAMTVYEEALGLARAMQVHKVELNLLNDQATTFILQEKPAEAQNLIRLSLELAAEYNLPEAVGLSRRNQAWLEFLVHTSYKRALTELDSALDIFSNYQTRLEETRTKFNQASVLFASNQTAAALTALTESLTLAQGLGFEPFLPFEIKWANTLLEYATTHTSGPTSYTTSRPITPESSPLVERPVAPTIENAGELEEFLRRRGFIAALSQVVVTSPPLVAELTTTPEAQPQSQPSLRLAGLNGGRVWVGLHEVENWGVKKAQEGLFYLVEHPRCSRDEIIEALWPDAESVAGVNLFHNMLSHLRKALGNQLKIKLHNGRYDLEGTYWYDVAEFSRMVTPEPVRGPAHQPVRGSASVAALNQNAEGDFDAAGLQQALNLYRRDFLDQFYANWILEQQQQLMVLFVNGLRRLASWYTEQQRFQEALPLWQELIRKDPYDEMAYRAIVSYLLANGHKAEALRQYEKCRLALEELDLQPSPETLALLPKLS
jgi:DNA-binding SARP family transcriptional activator